MDEPLIEHHHDDDCCWPFRLRRRRRRRQRQRDRFAVIRRLTELTASLRAKIRINRQIADDAIEEAKKARVEGRKDDAIFHMKRAKAFQAVNRQHSGILITLEMRQVQLENDHTTIADALAEIEALPAAPPPRAIVHESPPPPQKVKKEEKSVVKDEKELLVL